MMNTVIIDDEPLARNIVKEYLVPYPEIQVAAECNDGFEGMKAIMQFEPELVFLDIQMPKINGFEMLELIENPPAVIFTTAFDEYALKAFELNATDYLLKPFSRDRFDRAVQKFLQQPASLSPHQVVETAAQSEGQQNRVVVKEGNKIKVIPVSQIHFLEAADDYVKIVTADGHFLKKRTMAFFEESLRSHQFVRIHRSYLVNTQMITRIEPYEKESHLVLLSSGQSLPVSKPGYAKLKEVLGI
ncbi:MAG: LytTR family transcriptional regulator DNA-binding domain-containing protein [Bacteroidota bacterium]|nr:LytTR family transcriptional regulator DNA-binding domain-containing protein [Bacteroidota bacterium]